MRAQRFEEEFIPMPDEVQPQEDEQTVSVVMVSYHTGSVLWRSIESVLRQRNLQELVIVDNGNPKPVQQKLLELAKQNPLVRYIVGHGNIGFAKACNNGVKHTTGHYLLLLNPDCILPLDALKRTLTTFEKHPKAWVAGCSLINPDHSEQGSSRRNILTPTAALMESFRLYRMLPKRFRNMRLNFHQPDDPSKAYFVPAISGAFMFMQKETYLKLGGIDEGYFLHVEDLDFCLQVKENGGKILHIPDLKVVHFHHTSNVSTFFVEYQKARGFTRYFRKNFKGAYFPGTLPTLYAAIYARLALKSALATLKMLHPKRLFFKSNMPHILEQRRANLLASHTQEIFQQPLDINSPVIVTGATGQVGLCVTRRLLAAGIKVIGQYRNTVVDFSHPHLSWLQADLKTSKLDLEEYRPETVIHTAALWFLPKHLETLSRAGVKRVIAFGSTSVFGKATSHNPYEHAVVGRLAMAERTTTALCAKLGMEFTILRPTLIYGVGLDNNISSIVRFIKRFECFPIYGIGKGKRTPVHADDLAISALSTIGNSATYGKSYNVCGGETLAYYNMVERIFYALDKNPMIVKTNYLPKLLDIYSKLSGKKGTNGEMAKRMNEDLVFDDHDARQDFGYNPRYFLAGERKDLEPTFKGE